MNLVTSEFNNHILELKVKKVAEDFGVPHPALLMFVRSIINTLSVDGDMLTDLFSSLEIGWKDRMKKERQLMCELAPLIRSQCGAQRVHELSSWVM